MCAVERDDEITSEQLDGLLDDAPTLDADRPQGQTEVRLTVVVDAETLRESELRAAAEGSDLNAAAAGAGNGQGPTPPELLRQRPSVSAFG